MDGLESDVKRIIERVSSDAADRVSYARDLWPRQQLRTRAGEVAPAPPALIVWPENEEEIIAIIRFAGARGIPLVPFGAGSGVCGGIEPSRQAIVLDLAGLTVEEALLGVTAEAARAAGVADVGRLTVGAHADLAIFPQQDARALAYAVGGVRASAVVLGGRVVHEAEAAGLAVW